MFGTRWQLFRLLGIPVSLDASWFFILALLTLSLANIFPDLMQQYYPEAAELTVGSYWIMGLLAAVAFFGCILLHEMGHAVVARYQRMPIRGITLFLFGGVADIGDEPRSASAEFFMAIAGPVVTIFLGSSLWLLAWLGYRQGWAPPVVIVLGYLAAINGIVLVFNMIPAFPLDGGRVLRSFLWGMTGNLRRATFWAALVGRAFAWVFIAWGVLNFFSGNWLGGIWIGLIGLFLSNAAQSGYVQVLVRQALKGESVRRFMNPDPIVVSPAIDLRQWVEDYVYRFHRKTFPVVSDGHLQGCIDTQALERIPREDWGQHTVAEVMRRDLAPSSIHPDADALEALRKMQHSGFSRLLVTDGDRLVGIISLKDLLRFFSLKIELEGAEPSNTSARRPFDRDTSVDSSELVGKR
ncbi:MAG: CBS domain-containing protein [Planctomycetes bacterium]|nr:CBS domain-containing protein [Planctomycetota bacterium]